MRDLVSRPPGPRAEHRAAPEPARIPSGAEPGHGQSLRTGRAWRGAGPQARRGLQGRPTYSSDEGLS
jgi:hypothetical protein